MNKFKCGTVQEKGCYSCLNCGTNVNLKDKAVLPPCPKCDNETFDKIDDRCRN